MGVLNVAVVMCRGVSTTLSAPAEAGATTVTVANGVGTVRRTRRITKSRWARAASAESAKIAFVNGDELTLEEPLANAHAGGEAVTHVAVADTAPAAVFNMQPSPGHVATLGASLLVGTIMVQVDLRNDGSYGLNASISDISTLISMQGDVVDVVGRAGAIRATTRCAAVSLG